MRRLAALATVLGFGLFAAEARAQAACPAPVVTGIAAGPGTSPDVGGAPHFRVGEPGRLRVEVRDATAVEIDWGDSERETVGVRGGTVRTDHVYARAGRVVQIVVTAFAACGARSAPGGHSVPVHPPCARSRGRDVHLADCDRAAGELRVSAGGVSTGGRWLSAPCRDSFSNTLPEPPEPVALPASCAAPAPRAVPGRLPVRPGRRVTVVLGAPAERLRATVRGTGMRGRAARRVGRSGRVWRIRLPSALEAAHDRLVLRADRAGHDDRWLAGIRVAG